MGKPADSRAVCYTTSRRARTVTAVTTLIASALLAACGGDGPTGPDVPGQFLGTYEVSTINDHQLPFAIFADTGYTYERMSGSIELKADGQYVASMTSRQTLIGKVDVFVEGAMGKWTRSGTQVVFLAGQDTVDRAEWAAPGKLTFVEAEGKATNTYVYVLKP